MPFPSFAARAEQPPQTPAVPHVTNIAEVNTWLEKRGERTRLNDKNIGQFGPRVEAALVDELEKNLKERDEKSIEQLRKYIRAVSCMTHPQETPAQFDRSLGQLSAHIETRQRELERSSSIEEARELDSELAEIQRVREAIDRRLLHADAEEATRCIEEFVFHAWKTFRQVMVIRKVDWETAQKSSLLREPRELLIAVRQLRDQLYFQRLYGAWMEVAATTPSTSTRKKL